MYPELFKIGGFPVRSFGVMLVVGFLLAYWLAARRAERFGFPKEKLADLSIWALIAGVVGARLFWVLQEWPRYAKDPWLIPNVREGGMTSYGGLLFGLLALWIICRRAGVGPVQAMDLVAAPVLLAHAVGRVGCFLNGCCYGGPCELPWAVTVRPESGGSFLGHPVQLYDALMSFAGVLVLLGYERRYFAGRRRGQLAALFLILYGLVRFISELFRIEFSSFSSFKRFPLTDAQLVALAVLVIGSAWFWRAERSAAREAAT